DQLAVPQVARREGSLFGRAAHDDLVIINGETGGLQLDVVLVGPEPRQVGICDRVAGDDADDRFGLIHRVLYGFHPHGAGGVLVGVAGNVADGEDVRVGGAAEFVNDDAVVAGEARLDGQLAIGNDADADHHGVCRNDLAGGKPHAGDPRFALDGGNAGVEAHVHALKAVLGLEEAGDDGAGDAGEHPVQRL